MEAEQRFFANAAHDLRTPLAVMRSEAEVALRGSPRDPDEARAVIESSLEEIRRMSSMVEQMLDLARSGSTQPSRSVSLQPLDLAGLASGHDSADGAARQGAWNTAPHRGCGAPHDCRRPARTGAGGVQRPGKRHCVYPGRRLASRYGRSAMELTPSWRWSIPALASRPRISLISRSPSSGETGPAGCMQAGPASA